MSAPAVPTSGIAGGVIEDSVSGVPTPVSTLQAPVADPAPEVFPHTGQSNAPDPYVYNQFIHAASVVWTTSMLPGTLLWSCALHPSQMNSILAYLTKIYNAWAGGFDFRIKVAGTGFHAGALALVRLPPNITPSSVSNPMLFNAFEWSIHDAKSLETFSKHLIDQRNVMYHWNPFDVNDPQTFGGYFALYVHIPLNTSSTGSSQIMIEIWNRAAQDFIPSQVIPPSIADSKSGPPLSSYEILFDLPGQFHPTLDSILCSQIICDPSVIGITYGRYGTRKLDGSNNSRPYVPWKFVPIFGVTGQPFRNRDGGDLTRPGVFSEPNNHWQLYCVPRLALSTGSTQFSVINMALATPAGVSQESVFYNFDTARFGLSNDPEPVMTPFGGECIVFFRTDAPAVVPLEARVLARTIQTVAMSQWFDTFRETNTLTPSTAILFQLIDRTTELGVAYFKLYFDGYFTTAPRTTILIMNFRDFRLQFSGIVSRTSPIPINPTFAANLMTLRACKRVKVDKLSKN